LQAAATSSTMPRRSSAIPGDARKPLHTFTTGAQRQFEKTHLPSVPGGAAVQFCARKH
jgi:hypothetical protein